MSRIIREHRVFGKAITVTASSEDEARAEIRKKTSLHIWEVNNISGNEWEGYVAEHENCFALND